MVREKAGNKVELQLGFLQVLTPFGRNNYIQFKCNYKYKYKYKYKYPQVQVHHVYEVAFLLGRETFPGQLDLYGQLDNQVDFSFCFVEIMNNQ